MPEIIPQLPVAFFEDIADKLTRIASVVAGAFLQMISVDGRCHSY